MRVGGGGKGGREARARSPTASAPLTPDTLDSSWAPPVAGSRPGAPHPALTDGRTESAAGGRGSADGGEVSTGSAAVRPAYELDELDDEWRALVAEVDDRLVAARAPRCSARERAAVVSALLASAPDEPAEAALDRAARLVRSARRAGAV